MYCGVCATVICASVTRKFGSLPLDRRRKKRACKLGVLENCIPILLVVRRYSQRGMLGSDRCHRLGGKAPSADQSQRGRCFGRCRHRCRCCHRRWRQRRWMWGVAGQQGRHTAGSFRGSLNSNWRWTWGWLSQHADAARWMRSRGHTAGYTNSSMVVGVEGSGRRDEGGICHPGIHDPTNACRPDRSGSLRRV